MDSGGWQYSAPGPESTLKKSFATRPPVPSPRESYGDNSCTQFAVLGLWRPRTGINVDRTLTKVEKRFSKNQTDDGGWAYIASTKDGKAPSGES